MINDMIVGMENLPNVFIDKIQVYSRSNGYRIVCKLKMFDHIDNPSWKREEMSDMKIKVSYVSEKSKIERLNVGASSLYDFTVGSSRTKVYSSISFVEEKIHGDYKSYSLTVHEILPFFPANLNIYAACFFEDLGFNNNPIFSKYYGPMVSENIFRSGQINTISSYFYYPDTNEEYGGPVHQKPDGTYMEGSIHSDEPHKQVVLVSEENYKLQFFNFDSDTLVGIGLYPPSSLLSVQGPITANNMSDFDPEFNPMSPVEQSGIRPNVVPTFAADTEIAEQITVEEPDFNLVSDPQPTTPPAGY